MSRNAAQGGSPPALEITSVPQPIESDFERFELASPAGPGGLSLQHPVFVKGGAERPPVLILHELTGMSWQCVRLARLIHDAGFRVYVPLFFGTTNTSGGASLGLINSARLCVNREFRLLQANVDRPITAWLRDLARHARAECGGRGVGVIGMCLTGAFGLTLLLDHTLNAAPVVCQPSIPLPLRHADLGLLQRDIPAMVECANARQLPIRALRFAGDKKCPPERMQAAEKLFPTLQRWDLQGDKHSTLTNELASGAETAAALADVINYLQAQLRPARSNS